MEIRTSSLDNDQTRIALAGRFDFSSHREFRAVTEQLFARGTATMEIDLGAVTYLDSSALGMLLMLRDKARTAHCELVLTHCSAPVRQVLEVANFQKLFKIT